MSAAVSITNLAEVLCLVCGATLQAPSSRVPPFCSPAHQELHKKAQQRARDARKAARPEVVLASRERNRRWCEVHRNLKRRNAWLVGPPPFARYLPGVSMSVSFEPRPQWPIVLRNTRALHGALTAILDEGHGHRSPHFALRQTNLSPSGWSVHWWHDAGRAFALRTVDGELYGRPTRFRFGPPVYLRAPLINRRGRRLLRIETITPVCIVCNGRATARTNITSENLRGTLGGEWLHRFGVRYIAEQDLLRLELVEKHREQVARVELGGKYGTVTGFEGSFVVETNAVGHWLLETAARVGLGSRTAFGFGQVRVMEVDR